MIIADILKKENIIRVAPEEHLSHCLARLSTSHDAAFVFDDSKLLGVINPYYSLIKSSYPGNSKVIHCLHHPPRIYTDYSLEKAAELFIESKIHYLPVFDRNENFVGIVSARRLLSHLGTLPIFKSKIETMFTFRRRPLTVVYEDETVMQAINVFRKTKFSKLVVIDRDFKLKGVLSYYDLISFMMTSKDNPGRREKKGYKVHLGSHRVKNFMKTYVLTLKKDNLISDVFKLILDKKIGSVVIVDENKHPQNIVTTRDLLRFYTFNQTFEIIRKIPAKIGKLLLRKSHQ